MAKGESNAEARAYVSGASRAEAPAASGASGADTWARLGADLAALRRVARVTGQDLARELGISQAKISKIERGAVRVSEEDTRRIAQAVGARGETVKDLAARAAALRMRPAKALRVVQPAPSGSEITIQRPADDRRVPNQMEVAIREGAATNVRTFEVMLIPGMLQISEYTRQILNGYFKISYGDSQPYWQETAEQVSVRARRQEALYDPTKTFEFVMIESSLSAPLLTPGSMLAQVDRLEAAAKLSNVTVRIVPNTAELGYPFGAGFTILDDERILVEVGSTPFILGDRTEVNFHQRLFEHYSKLAVDDPAPLFAEYKARYAEAARPK